MDNVTIDIDDYLSEAEKAEIAREAFRQACTSKSAQDFERILENSAYELVQREVDAAFDGKMAQTVKSKAIEVIKSLGVFTVFKPRNAWDRDESKGWTHLQAALDEHKGLISDRVADIIREMPEERIRDLLTDHLLDAIVDRLRVKP